MKAILFVLCSATIFSSCDSGGLFNNCRSEYYFVDDHLLGFELLDFQTGDNLLQIAYHQYNTRDTVKVYDSDWNVVFPGPIPGDGAIYFPILTQEADLGVLNQITQKEFYLYLEFSDIDTINVDFEMILNDCGDQIMQYMKIQYNDSIYFDALTNQVPGFSFYKK